MLSRTNVLVSISLVVAFFFAGQVACNADTIAITNPSFELPGATTNLDATGTVVPGWQVAATYLGSAVYDGGVFGAGAKTGAFELDVAYNAPTWQEGSVVTAGRDLGTNLAANTTYTLNVDLLRRKFNDTIWQNTIPLYVALHAGTNLLGQLNTPYTFAEPFDAEVKKDLQLVVTTGGAPAGLGDPLWIELGRTDTTGGPDGTIYSVYYDNVRLDATTVPEPSTAVLATGLVALLAYAWRKRR